MAISTKLDFKVPSSELHIALRKNASNSAKKISHKTASETTMNGDGHWYECTVHRIEFSALWTNHEAAGSVVPIDSNNFRVHELQTQSESTT